jgi:hypothetical protein
MFNTHITRPRHLTTPGYPRENIFFCGVAQASGTLKFNHTKNCRHFLMILTAVQEVLQNFLGNPRISPKEMKILF